MVLHIDDETVVRKVALKIIKLGMDTRKVIARFEAERQALAMLDHPHILFHGSRNRCGDLRVSATVKNFASLCRIFLRLTWFLFSPSVAVFSSSRFTVRINSHVYILLDSPSRKSV